MKGILGYDKIHFYANKMYIMKGFVKMKNYIEILIDV